MIEAFPRDDRAKEIKKPGRLHRRSPPSAQSPECLGTLLQTPSPSTPQTTRSNTLKEESCPKSTACMTLSAYWPLSLYEADFCLESSLSKLKTGTHRFVRTWKCSGQSGKALFKISRSYRYHKPTHPSPSQTLKTKSSVFSPMPL